MSRIDTDEDPLERARLDKETEVEIFKAVRSPDAENPVMPVKLKPADMFNFSCHKGVSCWNQCCHDANITLTPMDILRLSRHLDMKPREFLAEYTVPDNWDRADLPVAKLKMSGDDGKGACHFMNDDGCSVYEDRPATCRYYPLGLASIKPKGSDLKEDFFFLVKESHCKGHDEEKLQSVTQFHGEQGLVDYDQGNRGWIDILMKMASWQSIGGPGGKEIPTQTKQMFFLVSTDVDGFRQFVLESKFLDTYEIDPQAVEIIKTDDVMLLQLGFDWLQNVLFNDPTISMKENIMQEATAKARENMGAT
jgi:uncharacterized protein